MKDDFDVLLDALERSDAELADNLLDKLRRKNLQFPNDMLTQNAVPLNPDWKFPSIVQSFALLFDGYDWERKNGVNPFSLLSEAKACWKNQQLDRFSLSQLRSILFALQRQFHDAWGVPNPAFVLALLGAIRRKVKSRLFA